jgi:hypothetical protein
MNLKEIAKLNCTTEDLQELLKAGDFGSLNLPFRFSEVDDEEEGHHDYVWIPECECVGNLSTNDCEGAGEQTLLVVTLLKLLREGRLEVK